MKHKILHLILLSGLLFTACAHRSEKKLTDIEPVFHYDADIFIVRKQDTVARFRTEFADNEAKRETGLMYRRSMKDNQSMWFIFPDEQIRYFYMKNTYIPLDIIYFDKNKKIVSVAKNARPLDETSLPSDKPAQYVLEIKGGLFDKLGLKKGDSAIVVKKN